MLPSWLTICFFFTQTTTPAYVLKTVLWHYFCRIPFCVPATLFWSLLASFWNLVLCATWIQNFKVLLFAFLWFSHLPSKFWSVQGGSSLQTKGIPCRHAGSHNSSIAVPSSRHNAEVSNGILVTVLYRLTARSALVGRFFEAHASPVRASSPMCSYQPF